MIAAEVPIVTLEANDPLLVIEDCGDLTSVTGIEMIIKEGVSSVTVTKTYTLGAGVTVVGTPTEGKISVQVLAVDLAALGTGVFRYRVDTITAAKRTTVHTGAYIIRNT